MCTKLALNLPLCAPHVLLACTPFVCTKLALNLLVLAFRVPVAEDKAPNPTPAMVGAIHLAEDKAPNPTPAMVGARHSHHEISSRRADARVKSS